jgi:hypothetical protein
LVASKTAIMAALKIPGVALARTGDKFPLMGMSRAAADLRSSTLMHNSYVDLASAFRFGGLEGGKGPDSTNRRSRHPQGHQVLGRRKHRALRDQVGVLVEAVPVVLTSFSGNTRPDLPDSRNYMVTSEPFLSWNRHIDGACDYGNEVRSNAPRLARYVAVVPSSSKPAT